MPTNPLLALGLIVFTAIVLGIVGDWFRLPRVTSYLIAGVLCGPSLFGLVAASDLHHLEPIADIAMGLVLFNLGAHFSIKKLLRIRKHVIPIAIGDLLATFIVVTGGLLLFGQSLSLSLMLGCLAMATAPATTVLVLKELRSEGPVTESAQALVAFNNFACILVFELLLIGFMLFDGNQNHDLSLQAIRFLWTFGGSFAIGVLSGLLLSFVAGFLSTLQWMAALLAVITCTLGFCEIYPVSYMLTFLVMGFIVANTANDSTQDLAESERVTALLSIAFFAIHGAELNVEQFLQIGAVGAAYIVLRCVGKYVGIHFGARWGHESTAMRTWLGTSMLSQAGAAIALSAVAVSRNRAEFEPVQTIILGSVLFFEIVGPLLIRLSVVRSGEVPIAHIARHSSGSIREQLRGMWWKFRLSIDADSMSRDAVEGLTVSSLARSKVTGIPQDAGLDAIISHVEHSHDDTFPVIDSANRVVGIIRYPVLSECLFDPGVSKLARAEDIATPVERLVHPDEPASAVYDFFLESTDDCVPIVSREDRTMTGIVRRSDVRALLIRSRKRGGDH